jgi:CheY-like chemotaxis protein
MVTAMSEFSDTSRRGSDRPPKLKMLVVDDEPDNLDLLYRTFRREFQVLRAESGAAALEILSTEGEVAVIISDQRMAEMKGTEFLSRTVPQFPHTMRIILTGFTDVEDLVDAINAGQVYKYITKPWDPHELKVVVQRAAETYDQVKQRSNELCRAQAQAQLMSTIVQVTQQEISLDTCLQRLTQAFSDTFETDLCVLQRVEAGKLARAFGIYPPHEDWMGCLENDPLAQKAISTGTLQSSAQISSDDVLAQTAHYNHAGIQSHVLIPICFQERVLAVLSLQWRSPHSLQPQELDLLQLAAQQVALVLMCTTYSKAVV